MALPDTVSLIAIGVGAFIATDIDDLVILVVLFLDRSVHPASVVAGQFLGIAVLVAISLLGSLGLAMLPREIVGLLGIVPLSLGLRRLYRRNKRDDESVAMTALDTAPAFRQVLSIAAITLSAGGDNIGTYVPLFAMHAGGEALLLVATFIGMTGLWCAAAFGLSLHPVLRNRIELIGGTLLPYVLVIAGLSILMHGHSYALLSQWIGNARAP